MELVATAHTTLIHPSSLGSVRTTSDQANTTSFQTILSTLSMVSIMLHRFSPSFPRPAKKRISVKERSSVF